MTTDDLAHDVVYLETMTKAIADTSAKLVADVVDLRARLERLPAIVTDVRIGPGDYHACPRDLAPMENLVRSLRLAVWCSSRIQAMAGIGCWYTFLRRMLPQSRQSEARLEDG
jgi:hypothetical protein